MVLLSTLRQPCAMVVSRFRNVLGLWNPAANMWLRKHAQPLWTITQPNLHCCRKIGGPVWSEYMCLWPKLVSFCKTNFNVWEWNIATNAIVLFLNPNGQQLLFLHLRITNVTCTHFWYAGNTGANCYVIIFADLIFDFDFLHLAHISYCLAKRMQIEPKCKWSKSKINSWKNSVLRNTIYYCRTASRYASIWQLVSWQLNLRSIGTKSPASYANRFTNNCVSWCVLTG